MKEFDVYNMTSSKFYYIGEGLTIADAFSAAVYQAETLGEMYFRSDSANKGCDEPNYGGTIKCLSDTPLSLCLYKTNFNL